MNRRRIAPAPFIGMGLLACLLFLDGASILFLPWWGVLVLYVVWVPLFLRACRAFDSRPRVVLLMAALGLLAWLGAVGAAVLSA
ncbi:hypothetical protein [Nocardioides terrisoli]|uniref:hypothetical protein n=1 Tax=Nocardioides terrisoli TaxID=3388267 RepID=UPI00287BA35A|nr:hypothetical protein [Nocardioides marmorisolisilvae]